MFRYYQIGDRGNWIIERDDTPENPWKFAYATGASRVTVLALSSDPDLSGSESTMYQGPLYFDIDHKDLGLALDSGRELCKKILNLGVDPLDLEIHLSGTKGIHLFIKQTIFHPGKMEAELVKTYRELALALFVHGMDMQVYSAKKGRLMRPPDGERAPGKYKVMVSYKELLTMTPEKYAILTSKPRGITEFKGPEVKSDVLAASYRDAKKRAGKTIKATETKGVPDDTLKILGLDAPPCVEALANGHRNKNSNFNQITLNVGCWSSKIADLPVDYLDSIHSRIAENNPSSKGVSFSNRKYELQKMHGTAAAYADKYDFSCASIRTTLDINPCADCALKGIGGSNIESLFLYVKDGKMYPTSECISPATTFLMERNNILKDEDTKKTISSQITVTCMGQSYKMEDFNEAAWTSKALFKSEMSGLEGAIFLGTDNDVQRIKLMVSAADIIGERQDSEKWVSKKVGISFRRREDSPSNALAEGYKGMLTYVEVGHSRNTSGICDSHVFLGTSAPGCPKLSVLEFSDPIPHEADEAFQLLMKCNFPATIAPILGWYLLSHLKQHVYQAEHRGVLLCISGQAGTGKNATTALFQRLAGLEGESALKTLEAPSSTKLPFQQGLSNSTTIPRVINELNKKSMNRWHYRELLEILKMAFDSQSVTKGRLGGGDRHGANVSTIEWKVTAPVVTLSEEIITEPAVMQRAIRINLTMDGKIHGGEAFKQLEPRADDLVPWAARLINESLNTEVSTIAHKLAGTKLPKEMEIYDIPDRLRFGYRCVLMAYDWAIEGMAKEQYGVSPETIRMLGEMRGHYVDFMVDNAASIAKEAGVDEIDKIIDEFAGLAEAGQGANPPQWSLILGRHYVVDGEVLYLDTFIAYPCLKQAAKVRGDTLGLGDNTAFINAVKGVKYFINDKAITPLLPSNVRGVLSLDMNIMLERGLNVSIFQGY
jgi:hypothetical protein